MWSCKAIYYIYSYMYAWSGVCIAYGRLPHGFTAWCEMVLFDAVLLYGIYPRRRLRVSRLLVSCRVVDPYRCGLVYSCRLLVHEILLSQWQNIDWVSGADQAIRLNNLLST